MNNQKFDEIPQELNKRVQKSLLLGNQKRNQRKLRNKMIIGSCFSIFAAFVVVLNVNKSFAKSLNEIPFINGVAQVFTFAHIYEEDESFYINVKVPQIENTNSKTENKINDKIKTVINQQIAELKQRAKQEYTAFIETGGNKEDFIPVNITIKYTTTCNDENYLSFIIQTTSIRASSYTSIMSYTIDEKSDQIITLKDLFGENYNKIIADEIRSQIQNSNEQNLYFDLDSLEYKISEDQNFYINEQNEVVVIFDKYEIGVGILGNAEFIIPR